MKQQATFSMLAKTFKGLEEVLAQELIALGANEVQLERRAVSFRGDKALLYRANLCLRTALRILVPIASFKAKDTDALYNQLKKINWSAYMQSSTTLSIARPSGTAVSSRTASRMPSLTTGWRKRTNAPR